MWYGVYSVVSHRGPPAAWPDVVRLLPLHWLGGHYLLPAGWVYPHLLLLRVLFLIPLPGQQPLLLLQTGRWQPTSHHLCQSRKECPCLTWERFWIPSGCVVDCNMYIETDTHKHTHSNIHVHIQLQFHESFSGREGDTCIRSFMLVYVQENTQFLNEQTNSSHPNTQRLFLLELLFSQWIVFVSQSSSSSLLMLGVVWTHPIVTYSSWVTAQQPEVLITMGLWTKISIFHITYIFLCKCW